MKTTLLIIIPLWVQTYLWAQTPIIFIPGPGNNDGTDQGSLSGGKDTYVLEVNPTTNYGDAPVVYSFPITTCNSWNQIGLIQFDLSTLPIAVDSVFLHFWSWDLNTYCYSNCDNNWNLWYVGEPWNEMTVTWNDQPVIDSAFAGSFNVVFPRVGAEESYDITSAYRNWQSGTVPNYGLAFKPIDGLCSNAAVSFGGYSSDDTTFGGTHRPYLEIYATAVWIKRNVGRRTCGNSVP